MFDVLRSEISGELIEPSGPEFETLRHVWNGLVDHHPAAIAQCTGERDVQSCVRFATEHGLPISVLGAGHDVSGMGIANGALVVDLRKLREVKVDPETRTARVQGGAMWSNFDAATAAHGLASTGGAVSSVGVVGFTLSGGHGALMRAHSIAADNVVAARVVTAAGDIVEASATENPDLYWALRGGGGNFGVVTELTVQLHPLVEVTGGLLLFPHSRTAEVLRVFREEAERADEALSLGAYLMTAHPGDGIPDELADETVIAITVFDIGEEPPALELLRALGPAADLIDRMPYTDWQQAFDDPFAEYGNCNYWKSEYLAELSDEFIDAVAAYPLSPSPMAVVEILQRGGALSRVPEDAAAYAHRSAPYSLAVYGLWREAKETARNVSWGKGLWELCAPVSAGGSYVAYVDLRDEGQDRVRSAFGADKWDRLVEIKGKYDPTNVFSSNRNVVPMT